MPVIIEEIKPQILLISLNFIPLFDETYKPLLEALTRDTHIQRVKHADSAIRRLSEGTPPMAVLVTDEALANDENSRVWEAVLQYVRQGGRCVVMGHFASFVPQLKIKPFFEKAGLEWEVGSYTKETCVINKEAVEHGLAVLLPASYTQQAVFVKNVALEEAWFATEEGESVVRVRPPKSAETKGEAPIALAQVGEGKLGYVGDVNGEQGSDAVILAMCGLYG